MHLNAPSKQQKVRSPRNLTALVPACLVPALLTITRISDPRPLHLAGFRTYAFSGNVRLQHLPPSTAALPAAYTAQGAGEIPVVCGVRSRSPLTGLAMAPGGRWLGSVPLVRLPSVV